jgi:hypothetical protein
MLFEAVIGCGSLNPCRLLADYLLACQPGHRRPCGGVAEERPALPKVGVPSSLLNCVETRRGWCQFR